MLSLICLHLVLLNCVLLIDKLIKRVYHLSTKVIQKLQKLKILLWTKLFHHNSDFLALLVEEMDVPTDLCHLLLHKHVMWLVVFLEAIPDTEIYILLVNISAALAYGLTFFPTAVVAQCSFCRAWTWEMIMCALIPPTEVIDYSW
jgi:hypothetical protein